MCPRRCITPFSPNGAKITRGKLRGVESDGMLCSLKELGLTTHDYPYGEIKAAAILGDYHPIDPEKPSIAPDIAAGDKIFGTVVAAEVTNVEEYGVNLWKVEIDGGSRIGQTICDCQNVHIGDMVAYDGSTGKICTLADLRAKQEEFPPLHPPTASSCCMRTASPATTSARSSAWTTMSSSLRSPPTARTACA